MRCEPSKHQARVKEAVLCSVCGRIEQLSEKTVPLGNPPCQEGPCILGGKRARYGQLDASVSEIVRPVKIGERMWTQLIRTYERPVGEEQHKTALSTLSHDTKLCRTQCRHRCQGVCSATEHVERHETHTALKRSWIMQAAQDEHGIHLRPNQCASCHDLTGKDCWIRVDDARQSPVKLQQSCREHVVDEGWEIGGDLATECEP
jgi:hypothetical protein